MVGLISTHMASFSATQSSITRESYGLLTDLDDTGPIRSPYISPNSGFCMPADVVLTPMPPAAFAIGHASLNKCHLPRLYFIIGFTYASHSF